MKGAKQKPKKDLQFRNFIFVMNPLKITASWTSKGNKSDE